ncbi:MAG: GNAT superfamily N-acetyltransferase [Halobacteriales archaeon]
MLNGAEGIVDRVYVVPEYRRRGIGTDLFEFTIEELTDRGVERFVALALAGNDVAADFFDVAGFERMGTDSTTIAGEEYDEIVFERRI